MSEQWKEIAGFEGRYEVSNKGKVRSLISAANGRSLLKKDYRILQPGDYRGYKRVSLTSSNGKRKFFMVHRLVLSAFMPIENNMMVNHIDGNKENNSLENLEWCTCSENMKHAYRLGLEKPCVNGLQKHIKAIKGGKVVGTFSSIRELCRTLKLDRRSVQRVINGKYKHTFNYTFDLE